MAQADGVVANASGAAVRTDLNGQLAAVFTNHSGSTQPSTIFDHMWWYDESAKILKLRNDADTGWVNVLKFSTGAEGASAMPNGTVSAPALFFSSNDDVGLFYDSTYGSLSFARDGVKQSVFGRTLEGQTNAIAFGPCASQTTTVNPSNGTNSNKATVKGLSIQDDGPLHIGTVDGERPLTLNKMGSYGSNDANTQGNFLNFNTNGTYRGGIVWNGSAVSITTTSDYRLKENISSLTGAIDRLKLAKPVRFNYISDERNQEQDGFLAHEVGEIVPEMLYGSGKDAVDSSGNIEQQSINMQGLVPLLTAALQESIAKIEALEARVAALEAN